MIFLFKGDDFQVPAVSFRWCKKNLLNGRKEIGQNWRFSPPPKEVKLCHPRLQLVPGKQVAVNFHQLYP